MKKILFVVISIVFILSISACERITYTEELPFLPKYEGMEFKEIVKSEANVKTEFTTATYIVKDAKADTVMEEYEKVFHEDGWTTTYDNKPQFITVAKEEHEANIMAFQQENDVMIAIAAK